MNPTDERGGGPGRSPDRTLAAAIAVWAIALALSWIAYSKLHGFDPSLCWSYGGCREYRG